MALYRLYKSEWEQQLRPTTDAYRAKTATTGEKGKGKRKREAEHTDVDPDPAAENDEGPGSRKKKKEYPGGGRKGISSGLSVVVKRNGQRVDGDGRARRREGESGGGTGGAGSWWEEAAT